MTFLDLQKNKSLFNLSVDPYILLYTYLPHFLEIHNYDF